MKKVLGFLIAFLSTFQLFAQDFQSLSQGTQYYQNQNWEKAKLSYEKIIQQNPFNGQYLYRLGWIHYQLQNFELAAKYFTQSFDLGNAMAMSSYNAACAFARNGKQAQAVEWLKKSLAAGLNNHDRTVRQDSDLDGLRELESYQRFFPNLNPSLEREAGWKSDIEYFQEKFEWMHHNLFQSIDQTEWQQSIKRLKENIGAYPDHRIIVELMRLASSTGAGHSYVIPPFNGVYQFHQLPIELYEFSDGIFIRKVKTGYESLLGKKVLAIEGLPIEEVIRQVSVVANPENKVMNRWTSLFYATLPEVLQAFDITKKLDEVTITVQDVKGNQEISCSFFTRNFDVKRYS